MQENIKTEFFKTREDGVPLVKTYSVNKKMIVKSGTDEMYDVAIDVGVLIHIGNEDKWFPEKYIYDETDIDVSEQDGA